MVYVYRKIFGRLHGNGVRIAVVGDEQSLQVVVAVGTLAQYVKPDIDFRASADRHGMRFKTGARKASTCMARASSSGIPRLRI